MTALQTQIANSNRVPSIVRWMAAKAEVDSYNDLRWAGRFQFENERKAHQELQAAADRGVGGYFKAKKANNPCRVSYKLEMGETMLLVQFMTSGRVEFITITEEA